MPNTTMKTQIQVRRDTTANWLANKDVVPAAGEPCFDLELGTLKIGDGVTTYENLKAISGASAAHYEGVTAEGESDNDVITRVLTAAGVTAEAAINHFDIANANVACINGRQFPVSRNDIRNPIRTVMH